MEEDILRLRIAVYRVPPAMETPSPNGHSELVNLQVLAVETRATPAITELLAYTAILLCRFSDKSLCANFRAQNRKNAPQGRLSYLCA
jgi:hypothetical protein